MIRCERILHEAAELEVSALNMTDQLSGVIRISAPIALTQHLLLDVVEAFTELHPQVTIELFASDRFTQLVDERIDIALRYTDSPDENLIARKLMKIDSVICAAPSYLELNAPIETISDLKRSQLLSSLRRVKVAVCKRQSAAFG